MFSRAFLQLHVVASSSDWFITIRTRYMAIKSEEVCGPIIVIFLPFMLVGSLKKDHNVLAKNVEGLTKSINDAVVKVKVCHWQSGPFD